MSELLILSEVECIQQPLEKLILRNLELTGKEAQIG